MILLWGGANSSHNTRAIFCGDQNKLHHPKIMLTVLELVMSM